MTMLNILSEIAQAEIDAVNQRCYELLSGEYDDASHQTCRNFEEATSWLLGQFASAKILSASSFVGKKILDVGVGTGFSISSLQHSCRTIFDDHSVTIVDISQGMLKATESRYPRVVAASYCSSICNPDLRLHPKADWVIGLLCDPYLTPRALQSMNRALSVGGRVLLTLPSAEWRGRARLGGKSYLTTFKLADKQTASSYSFCWEPHELIAFCSKELGWRLEAALRSPAEVVTKPSLSVSLCASGEVLVNGFVFCKAERSGSVDED